MLKRILRISLLTLLLAALVSMPVCIYAEDGSEYKDKTAYGAAVNSLDYSQYGPDWEQFGTLRSLLILDVKDPHKGFFNWEIFEGLGHDAAGSWGNAAGSWGNIEVKELYFGDYNGQFLGQNLGVTGCPAAFFLGRYTSGESCVDGNCVNLEGYYKIGAFIDGGPVDANDYLISFADFPPEGMWWLSDLGDDGEEQAQSVFDILLSGNDLYFYYSETIGGSINIE